MEQTLIYTKTTEPMSRCYSYPNQLVQNQEILIDESPNEPKGSSFSSREETSSPDFIMFGPASIARKDEQDDIEDEESDFKMGRLIRQASLNSSQMCTPQQTTKIMRSSSGLPQYLSQKPETNQENLINMRKVESLNERNRNKSSKKIEKMMNVGASRIPGGWVDKGLSEDMKAKIKYWARAVAVNMHHEY